MDMLKQTVLFLTAFCLKAFADCDIFSMKFLECSSAIDFDLQNILVSLDRIEYALLNENYFYRPNLTLFNKQVIKSIDLNQNNALDCSFILSKYSDLPIMADQCFDQTQSTASESTVTSGELTSHFITYTSGELTSEFSTVTPEEPTSHFTTFTHTSGEPTSDSSSVTSEFTSDFTITTGYETTSNYYISTTNDSSDSFTLATGMPVKEKEGIYVSLLELIAIAAPAYILNIIVFILFVIAAILKFRRNRVSSIRFSPIYRSTVTTRNESFNRSEYGN